MWYSQLYAILLKLGLKVRVFTSEMSTKQRSDVVNEFNDPDIDIDSLIYTLSLSIQGYNLHKACWQGQCGQLGWNNESEDQAMRRLERIGQTHAVEWVIWKNTGTYQNMQELRGINKSALDLAGKGRIPEHIQGPLRQIVAFEMLRIRRGQSFNRYTWVHSKPEFMSEWDSAFHYQNGRFLSFVARLVLGLPKEVPDKSETGATEPLDLLELLGANYPDLAMV